MDPHLVVVEYNSRGKVIKTLIEIQFDVNVGFVNQTDPLPSGSIVRLEFIPVSQYRGGLCEGLPQVLLRAVVENHFTLHDGQPGIFRDFRRSCNDQVNHTTCFYTPQKQKARCLVDHRPDHSTYTQCPLPRCYCINLTASQHGGFGGPPSNPGNPGTQTQGGIGGPLLQGPNPGQSTQSGQQGLPSPALPGGGHSPHPGQSTQSGQQGLPSPALPGGGHSPHPGQSTQSGQQGLPSPALPGGGHSPHSGQSTESGQQGLP